MTTEPTDAELKAMWQLHAADIGGIFYYARAVLAKWGQPAQAAEPVAWLRNTTDPQPHAVTNLKYRSAVDAEAGVEYIPVFAAPQPVQAQADGFFLLLPQRPKPEAPAGTAGLDWAAYSGAQMLAFGRDCSDAAIAALRTEQPAPATQQAGERVYAFRRKGLADFCTCDEARYEEVSNKPHLFETRIFYTAPMPVAREPLSDEQIEALPMWKRFVGLWPETRREIVRIIEAQHGIKGGQHGTE